MSGSNPHEQKGVGTWCPHPLLIFNDSTFVFQILLCTPCMTNPNHIPSPIHLFTHLLGIRKMLRLSRLRILLRDHFCFSGFFCCWFSFPSLFFMRKKEKGIEKEVTSLKWCFTVCWKREAFMKLWVCQTVYMTVQVGSCQAPDRLLMLHDRDK